MASDEDVLTYAMFPQVAPNSLRYRDQGPKNLGKDPAAQTVGSARSPPTAAPGGATDTGPLRGPSHL